MRIAVITGAGSGIGRAVALALIQEGYGVVLAGRRFEPLQQIVSESTSAGSQVMAVPTDVTQPESVRNLFAKTVEQFGRLDLLFNNAGINAPNIPLEVMPVEKWTAVLNTNLTGAFLCTKEAFAIMKNQRPQGGRIINNGSVSAHVPRPNSAPYTASKHGVTGLTYTTALDGRLYNIVCGQIDIANADTTMAGRMAGGVPQADGTIAPEPTIHVDHIVKAIVYMAKLPLEANVPFMTVMASQMPYIGRG